MSLLRVERSETAAVLTLDDPGRRNVLSRELCSDVSRAVAEAVADEAVHALVICAEGPAFCAGADLGDLRAAASGNTANVEAVYKAFMDVANCPLPTIAAVQGPAVGAGMNLALACDMRVAGERAMFDTRFLKIGLHPGGGHGWMLLRAVGWAEGTRLLLLSGTVGSEEALRIGLVQQVTPDDGLRDAAITLARRADELPRSLMMATKASLRSAAVSSHAEAFAHETAEQMRSLGEPSFRAFLDRVERGSRS